MFLNVQTVFDPAGFEKRKCSPYAEVIEDLKDLTPIFNKIFMKAFDLTTSDLSQKPRHYMNKNSASLRMNENIQGLAVDEFGVQQIKFESHKVFYLDWLGKYKIYFKKLNSKFMPQYNTTQASEKRLYQRELFEDDSNPILYVGYQVDDLWSSIQGIYLVNINDGSLQWRETLSDINLNQLSFDSIQEVKNDQSEELLVRPKKSKKKKSN